MKKTLLLSGLILFTFQVRAVVDHHGVRGEIPVLEQNDAAFIQHEKCSILHQSKGFINIADWDESIICAKPDSIAQSNVDKSSVSKSTTWNKFMHNASKSRWKIGLKVGMNMNRFKTYKTHVDYNKFRIGYNFGFLLDYQTKYFLFQPGINYCSKGAEKRYEKKIINYIEIPLNLSVDLFKQRITGCAQPVRFNLAPYGAYALNGKHLNDPYENNIEFGENVGEFNRFDYGLKIGFSIQLGSYEPSFGYDLGLNNLSNEYYTSIYNRGYYINFAIIFGK